MYAALQAAAAAAAPPADDAPAAPDDAADAAAPPARIRIPGGRVNAGNAVLTGVPNMAVRPGPERKLWAYIRFSCGGSAASNANKFVVAAAVAQGAVARAVPKPWVPLEIEAPMPFCWDELEADFKAATPAGGKAPDPTLLAGRGLRAKNLAITCCAALNPSLSLATLSTPLYAEVPAAVPFIEARREAAAALGAVAVAERRTLAEWRDAIVRLNAAKAALARLQRPFFLAGAEVNGLRGASVVELGSQGVFGMPPDATREFVADCLVARFWVMFKHYHTPVVLADADRRKSPFFQKLDSMNAPNPNQAFGFYPPNPPAPLDG